jgi:Ca2+-binding RTX toxin-like protein
MQYLNWSGTYDVNEFTDLGSPGDRPTKTLGYQTQVQGILNFDIWGDGLDIYTIYGTSDADVIFLDRLSYDVPRLTNVRQVEGGAGNDVIDMTSMRFKYAAVTLYGGVGNDWLLGNSGSDRLIGQDGADRLKGYGGNDHLSGGNNSDHLYGGRGNDRLSGGSGNDYLMGQLGKDVLTGGKGSDRFVFDVTPAKANTDTITDYSVKYDSIQLAKATFAKAGAKGGLKAKAFWNGSAAHDEDDRIIYNDETGYLYYDPDGTGGASQKTVAKLSKDLQITHKDFFII